MRQRRRRSGMVQPTVRHPAVILTPSDLDGVGSKVLAANVVVLPDLGAAEAGEVSIVLPLMSAASLNASSNSPADMRSRFTPLLNK